MPDNQVLPVAMPRLLVLTQNTAAGVTCSGFEVCLCASVDELVHRWLADEQGVVVVGRQQSGDYAALIGQIRAVIPQAALIAEASEAQELMLIGLGVQEVVVNLNDDLQRTAERARIRASSEKDRNRGLYHDPLTGLANRSLFLDRLDHALVQGFRHKTHTGLLYIGMDRFRVVNELHGYAAGDELLVACARRLQGTLRRSDTLARIGGDVFAVVLDNIPDEEILSRTADKVRQAFLQPFHCAGSEIFLSLSIGMELSSRVSSDAADMLRHAELAMHQVRRDDHRSYLLYDDQQAPVDRVRAGLESALYHALERDELNLVYQPQVDISSGHFTGVEVLLRWHHPVLGDVSPVVFIPVLEETGLIASFGRWVLEHSVQQFADWLKQQEIPSTARLSVNLSPRQFGQPDLVAQVSGALSRSGLPASQLTLEITESTLMHNMQQSVEQLHELRALGVSIAIDDFGTGYSSLAYLKDLPIDYLKIDRVFVKDIVSNAHDAAIASSIISLAHNLGLSVVAEGVENTEVLDLLNLLGCDQYQGFFFSRPLPPAELPAAAQRCA